MANIVNMTSFKLAGDRRQCMKWKHDISPLCIFHHQFSHCARNNIFLVPAQVRLALISHLASNPSGPVVFASQMQYHSRQTRNTQIQWLTFGFLFHFFLSLGFNVKTFKRIDKNNNNNTKTKSVSLHRQGASLVFPIPLWIYFSVVCFGKMLFWYLMNKKKRKERLESSSLFWFLEIEIRASGL